MEESTVKWFDAKKGYGFIDHPGGGNDVFVHYSQIVSTKDFKTLRTGQEVKFNLEDGPKGLHALDVEPLEEEGDGSKKASADDASSSSAGASAPQETPPSSSTTSSSAASPPAGTDGDEWDWDAEDWTDEHGNPPDPMASPSF